MTDKEFLKLLFLTYGYTFTLNQYHALGISPLEIKFPNNIVLVSNKRFDKWELTEDAIKYMNEE